MAEHLASIFGTEKDRVNCPFYFKMGACRHGDRCSRIHNKPTMSQTVLLANLYQSLDAGVQQGFDATGNPVQQVDMKKVQEHFEDFYEDIFEELSRFGEIENLNVCDNLADHMVGNVYVKFREEEAAGAALQALTGRFYAGRPIIVDFSPVTDFREATCRQYEENTCHRGGYCNFMHLKRISRELRKKLFGRYRKDGSQSRSPSPEKPVARSRSPPPRRGRDDRDRDAHRVRRERSRSPVHRGGPRDRDREREGRGRERERDGHGGRDRHDRAGSEERRRKIEQWNREREAVAQAPAQGGLPPPAAPGAAPGAPPPPPGPPPPGQPTGH
eukprot:jgi/Chlat1/3092/Chrsp21S03338